MAASISRKSKLISSAAFIDTIHITEAFSLQNIAEQLASDHVRSLIDQNIAAQMKSERALKAIEDNIADKDEPVMRTVIDTIREYPIFEHVYIAFGLNELGWAKQAFINTYEEVVKQIQQLLPDADIYFQAVLPVSKATSDKGTNGVTNAGVREYNRQLQELAEEMGCYYLAIDEIFTDENGDMPAELLAADGIHFGGPVARDVMKYVRTHVVQYDDYIWED